MTSHQQETEDLGEDARRLSLVQGSYYAATGLWALLHLRSFEAVTGPKIDRWLVKTVGVLVTVIGGTLLSAGLRRGVSAEVGLLGAGSAAGLAGIELFYGTRGRIARVYLADAVAQTVLVGWWAMRAVRARPRVAPALRPGSQELDEMGRPAVAVSGYQVP